MVGEGATLSDRHVRGFGVMELVCILIVLSVTEIYPWGFMHMYTHTRYRSSQGYDSKSAWVLLLLDGPY